MQIKTIVLIFLLSAYCQSQTSFDTTGRSFAKLYGVELEKTSIEKVQKLLGIAAEY